MCVACISVLCTHPSFGKINLALLLKCNNFYYYLSLFRLLMGASLDCEQIKVNVKHANPKVGLNTKLLVKQLLWTKRPQLCPCLSVWLNFKARQLFCANYSRALKLLDPTLWTSTSISGFASTSRILWQLNRPPIISDQWIYMFQANIQSVRLPEISIV